MNLNINESIPLMNEVPMNPRLSQKQCGKLVISILILAVASILAFGLVFSLCYRSSSGQIQKSLFLTGKLTEQQGEWTQISNVQDGNVHKIKLEYSKPGEYFKKKKSTYTQNINLEVTKESPSEMTFKMFDTEQQLFNIPNKLPFPYSKDYYDASTQKEDTYGYEMMENDQQLRVFSKHGDKKTDIFNTKDTKIIFSKLYTEIQTSVDTQYIWGLGDRRTANYKLESGNYTIWNKDQYHIDKGKPGGQLYGTHPMWMQRDINGNYHIIMIHSANSMQFEYKKQQFLNFKIVGGIAEIKFLFGGSNPREVIKKYHRYVNGWALHPFWSSGWHQSRWGYNSSSVLLEVVQNYTNHKLPIDTIWSDLDYMDARQDFTLDTTNFIPQDMQKLTNTKNIDGVQWVPIIDPGIAVDSGCGKRGLDKDIFIKSTKVFDTKANGTQNLIGCVWPGKVFYPDFNHPKSKETWHECFLDFNSQYNITPSGIWIDMNEMVNFISGELDPSLSCNETLQTKKSSSEIEKEDLPFNPQGDQDIDDHTVSISAIHYNEEDSLYLNQVNGNLTELNVHSLNGFFEGIATKSSQALIHKTNLTFVLSRSTFAGSGRFVQHWLGDNFSAWNWLSSSMTAIFNFNLYGIPLIGDDVCGFNGDSNAQLCARWLQLGSLYPFARNHNTIEAIAQEPWQFEDFVVDSARKSLNLRYSLLKFYYTQFVTQYDINIQAGVGTIFNPLFYLYDDVQALNIDRQFAIGDSIIVVPVVNEQQDPLLQETIQEFYIPEGAKWFEWFTGSVSEGPKNLTTTIKFSDTSLIFINQGRIVPISNTTDVYRSRYLPMSIGLAIGLEAFYDGEQYQYSAQGQYLSLQSYEPQNVEERCWKQETSCHRQVIVTGSSNQTTLRLTFTNEPGTKGDQSEDISIDNLIVYGIINNGQNLMKLSIPVQFSSLQSSWNVEIQL